MKSFGWGCFEPLKNQHPKPIEILFPGSKQSQPTEIFRLGLLRARLNKHPKQKEIFRLRLLRARLSKFLQPKKTKEQNLSAEAASSPAE